MYRSQLTDPFGRALMWGGLLLLAYFVVLIVSPFFVPLGWAAVFAILFYPVHESLAARWGKSRGALATTLTVATVVIAPMVLLVTSFTREAIDAAGRLQSTFTDGGAPRLEAVWADIQARLPVALHIDLNAVMRDAAGSAGAFVVAKAGTIARGVAGFIAHLVIALFATFFLLRDADVILHGIRRLIPMDASGREALITRTQDLIAVGVVSSLVVASVQGLLGGIVFALLGIGSPVFWGVGMSLCCLLPFGAWVIWLPWSIVLMVNGSLAKGLILAGLGLGIVSGVDNILRPLLLAGRTHMNGLVVFVSLLGGVSVFGLLGLVLGPIVVMTALALIQTYVEIPRTEGVDVT